MHTYSSNMAESIALLMLKTYTLGILTICKTTLNSEKLMIAMMNVLT
jgi:hypothetical protein